MFYVVCRKTFKSSENQAVLSKLVSEVNKGLNPLFDAAEIRGAFY